MPIELHFTLGILQKLKIWLWIYGVYPRVCTITSPGLIIWLNSKLLQSTKSIFLSMSTFILVVLYVSNYTNL